MEIKGNLRAKGIGCEEMPADDSMWERNLMVYVLRYPNAHLQSPN